MISQFAQFVLPTAVLSLLFLLLLQRIQNIVSNHGIIESSPLDKSNDE